MNIDNQPVKKGFIWVRVSDSTMGTPSAYKVVKFGETGVYHRVAPGHPNGGEPVTFDEYCKTEVPMW